jgi:hypothetical protein
MSGQTSETRIPQRLPHTKLNLAMRRATAVRGCDRKTEQNAKPHSSAARWPKKILGIASP